MLHHVGRIPVGISHVRQFPIHKPDFKRRRENEVFRPSITVYYSIRLPAIAQILQSPPGQAVGMKKCQKSRTCAHAPSGVEWLQNPRQFSRKRAGWRRAMYLSEDAAEFPGQTLIEWTHAPMRVGRTHAFEEADHQDGMLRIEIRASRHQCLERCQWAVILGRIVAIRFTRETCYHFGRVVLYLLDEPNRAAIDFYRQIVIAPRKIPDLNPLTAVQFREQVWRFLQENVNDLAQ